MATDTLAKALRTQSAETTRDQAKADAKRAQEEKAAAEKKAANSLEKHIKKYIIDSMTSYTTLRDMAYEYAEIYHYNDPSYLRDNK